MKVKSSESVTQSFPTLYDPMDQSLPGSSVHGIIQARILKWVAISYSWGSSQPKDRAQVSCISCTVRWIFTAEPPGKPISSVQLFSRVRLFETPRITACQASLSITNSRSSLRLTSIEVSDAIQPSHPLSSPSPPAPNPSQHQSLFQ